MKEEFISKTALLYLERCDRAFYLYKRFPWLKSKPDNKKQFLLDRGTHLGILARNLFHGGVDASENVRNFEEAYQKTLSLIHEGHSVIYEASLVWKGAGAMVDILIKTDAGWEIIEIKSSAKIYFHHVLDAAFQFFIFSKHLHISNVSIAIPDRNYVYHEKLDVNKLFKKVSVTKTAHKNHSYFEKILHYGLSILEKNTTPPINIDKHCFRPGLCEFASCCFPENLLQNPENIFSAENLTLEEKLDFYKKGIHYQPKKDPLSNETEKFNITMLYELKQIVGHYMKASPVFFDMEFYNGPIPFLNGHRPFDNVCIAFDIYYSENAHHETLFLEYPNLKNLEYLADQMYFLLKNCSVVITFDKKMEINYATFLSSFFPELSAKILKVMNASVDLQFLLREKSEGLPNEYKNKLSLKKLSDALGFNVHKENDTLKEGFDILMGYEKYMSTTNLFERKTLRTAIENYVQSDTERMHFICHRIMLL